MSTTALTRTDSRNNLTPAPSRQPAPQTNNTSSPLTTTVTSILPKLNLTPFKPGTPQKAGTPQQQPSPAISTPGQWQHPRMDEVIRRQNTTNFDGSNMRIIGLNAALILASLAIPAVAHSTLPRSWTLASEPYTLYTIYLLRAFFALNIALALTPLFRLKDACEDIPLTPAQRHHLGLPPMTRPATPLEQGEWVTPPRYSRSGTPQSSTNSMRVGASDSPLGGRQSATGSPLDGSLSRRSVSGSPFAPSPLHGGDQRRRLSFQSNRSSPLGGNTGNTTSDFDALGSIGTPTKSSKASVGLNSKWLYEKGRGSPRGSMNGLSGLAGFGGQGSVFS